MEVDERVIIPDRDAMRRRQCGFRVGAADNAHPHQSSEDVSGHEFEMDFTETVGGAIVVGASNTTNTILYTLTVLARKQDDC